MYKMYATDYGCSCVDFSWVGGREGGISEMMGVGNGEELAGSVECCMCGDHGLTKELFQCRSCHSRYQHKYCSNLYPKVESYKSCNWCLTDEEAKKTKKISSSIATAAATPTSDGSSLKRGRLSPWEREKPVKKEDTKKTKKLYRSTSDVSSGVRRGLKGKSRRYKLLEDVSS